MKPRRFRRASSVLAACLVLSACGSGQQDPVSRAHQSPQVTPAFVPASESATDSVAAQTPSRAQALAFARAVNLSASDIPEASVETERDETSDAREGRDCERLVALPHVHAIAEALSPKLKRGQELEIEQLRSSVAVLSDERALAQQFAVLATPRLRECAARVWTRNLDDKPLRQARWGRVTVSQLPVYAPGSGATIGIRIMAPLRLTFSEVSVPIYVDVLGFAMGRAEVTLIAVSATQPVPATTEQELVALLLARAKAHPL